MENELEAMIDKHGIRQVLVALSSITFGKGEHLENNWQDPKNAKMWFDVSNKIDEANSLVYDHNHI